MLSVQICFNGLGGNVILVIIFHNEYIMIRQGEVYTPRCSPINVFGMSIE